MNIVLFGQKWLAAEVFRALLAKQGVRVVAVCPDNISREEDRLACEAQEVRVPVVTIESVPECDLGMAVYCQRFIPSVIRKRCGLGVLAYHPSLLPRHRGRDAVHWTLAMRDPIAGGTTYWMDDGADTGPIESQEWCHVLPSDTPGELWRRELAPMGLRLLLGDVKRLASGGSLREHQQNPAAATWEPALRTAPLSSTLHKNNRKLCQF